MLCVVASWDFKQTQWGLHWKPADPDYLTRCHFSVYSTSKCNVMHINCIAIMGRLSSLINYILNLTPCDGYVSQPQSPVMVVVSSRFTVKIEQNNDRGKWWTLNDCFSRPPPSILSVTIILCASWHSTESRRYTHTTVWQVWLMRQDFSHSNSEPGVTVWDVTLTWFTLGALGGKTLVVRAQNRTGNKRFHLNVQCEV